MARTNPLDITNSGRTLTYKESKSVVFDGGTVNGIGDFDGTGNPVTLFTVTGTIAVRIFAVATVDLVGASATVAVGISGNTTALIASTTGTNLNANEVWVDNSPATIETLPSYQVIGAGQDIILTVGTANVTAGAITFYAEFYPISTDGDLVAA